MSNKENKRFNLLTSIALVLIAIYMILMSISLYQLEQKVNERTLFLLNLFNEHTHVEEDDSDENDNDDSSNLPPSTIDRV